MEQALQRIEKAKAPGEQQPINQQQQSEIKTGTSLLGPPRQQPNYNAPSDFKPKFNQQRNEHFHSNRPPPMPNQSGTSEYSHFNNKPNTNKPFNSFPPKFSPSNANQKPGQKLPPRFSPPQSSNNNKFHATNYDSPVCCQSKKDK